MTRGQAYRLGVSVGGDTPAHPPRSVLITVMMPDQFGGALVPSENKVSYADDMFVGWLGVGSQIDHILEVMDTRALAINPIAIR